LDLHSGKRQISERQPAESVVEPIVL
jgi:hypothetical protein